VQSLRQPRSTAGLHIDAGRVGADAGVPQRRVLDGTRVTVVERDVERALIVAASATPNCAARGLPQPELEAGHHLLGGPAWPPKDDTSRLAIHRKRESGGCGVMELA
jgi:hypothetical protein